MIVRRLIEHCIAAEIFDSGRNILIPRIYLYPSVSTIPFGFCRRRFFIKTSYVMSIRLKGRRLNMLEDMQRLFLSHGQLYAAFSQASSFDSVPVAIVEGH
jgi:hypothetical protein